MNYITVCYHTNLTGIFSTQYFMEVNMFELHHRHKSQFQLGQVLRYRHWYW